MHKIIKATSSKIQNYKAEVDFLRGFAIALVVVYHFFPEAIPNGYLGVDIFFVISGFVITFSLLKSINSGLPSRDILLSFFSKRAARILPALIVYVAVTASILCLFIKYPAGQLISGAFSLFGASNIYFYHKSFDYFAQSMRFNPFTQTWSLGVEEQFYLLFPFLILAGKRKIFHSLKGVTSSILVFLCTISLITYIYLINSGDPGAYFLVTSRFWELGTGCLCSLGFTNLSKKCNKITSSLLVISSLVSILIFSCSRFEARGILTISTILLTSIYLLNYEGSYQWIRKVVLNSPPILFLGIISYSLYLWHWGVLVIGGLTVGFNTYLSFAGIIISLIISYQSYALVEIKLRSALLKASNMNNLLSSVGAIILSQLFLVSLYFNGSYLFTGVERERSNNISSEDNNAKKPLSNEACQIKSGNEKINYNSLLANCTKIVDKQQKSGPKAWFIGDSHAGSLMKAQDHISKELTEYTFASHVGCPFPIKENGIKSKHCQEFNNEIKKKILESMNPGDIVVANIYLMAYLGPDSWRDTRHIFQDENKSYPRTSEKKRQLYLQGLKEFAKSISSRGGSLLLVGALPRNNWYELSEKQWFRPFPRLNTVVTEAERAISLNIVLRKNLREIKDLHIVNTHSMSKLIIDDPNFFRHLFDDGDHVSRFGAIKLHNSISEEIKKIHTNQQ